MGDGTEGFPYVGGVGDVAVGAEEDGAESGSVGGVAEVCVCG
jgi:hypothetical protein